MGSFKLTRDRLLGLVAIVFGITVLLMSMSVKSLIELTEPGPALFPRICGGGFILFGAMLVIRKPKKEDPFLDKAGWLRALSVYVALLIYVLIGLEFLGYLISTPFLLFALYMMLADKEDRPNPLKMALLALVIGAAVYFFFTKAIGGILPRGRLFEYFGIYI